MINIALAAFAFLPPLSYAPKLGALTLSDPKVTLTVQATSASAALKQLGSEVGVTLLTSPQTANEVITFRFNDVSLFDAMKRIAEAVDGSWKHEGEAFRLIRKAEQDRAERDAEFKLDVDTYRKSMQKLVEDDRKLVPWTADEADSVAKKVKALVKEFNPKANDGKWYERVSQLSAAGPIGRAIRRVCTLMDPEELANLPTHFKTVWSSNPTPMQRQIPSSVASVIQQFQTDQTLWSQAIQRNDLTPPHEGNTTYWVGDFGDLSVVDPSSISVVLLTANRWSTSGGISLDLSAYDAKGKKIAEANHGLDNLYDNPEGFYKELPLQPGESLVTPTDDAKTLLETRRRPAQARQPLPPALLDKLLHPEVNDPLGFALSPAIVQIAATKNVNMAACLDDDRLMGSFAQGPKPVTPDTYLNRLKFFGFDWTLSDGWLVVKPKRPYECRSNRVDRGDLGRYLRRISQKKPLSLDEQAAFALVFPEPQSNSMPADLADYIGATGMGYFDRDLLLFYGTLSREQKAAMTAGGFTFGDLREDQLEYVSRMVYGPNAYLQFQPPPSTRGADMSDQFNLFYNGIMQQTTESLPQGIPPKGTIKLTIDNSSKVIVPDDRYGNGGREFDANSLAWQVYTQNRPDQFPWMSDDNQRVDFSKVKFGSRSRYTFDFHFTTSLSLNQTLEDVGNGDLPTIGLNDLPGDFQKKYQVAYDNLVKNYANARPGAFGGPGRNANIPPTP